MNNQTPLRANIQETYLRVNERILYEDTQEDRNLIIHHLNNRVRSPKKTLIYYSVFGAEYYQIFKYSLKSIKKFTENVDFIAITDLANMPCRSIIVDSVSDFIQSSMKKMDIFEILGNEIYNYDNVLFLDCDVIAVRPLDFLQLEIGNKLHVVRSRMYDPSPRPEDFQYNYYHGLKIPLTESQRESIISNGYSPFNAGHFMFKPTFEMKKHFDNVRWLSKVWPGKYFYEQGFMNYYFCVLNSLADFSILNDKIEFYNLNTEIEPRYEGSLIHFIGKQTTPSVKLNHIRNAYHKFI